MGNTLRKSILTFTLLSGISGVPSLELRADETKYSSNSMLVGNDADNSSGVMLDMQMPIAFAPIPQQRQSTLTSAEACIVYGGYFTFVASVIGIGYWIDKKSKEPKTNRFTAMDQENNPYKSPDCYRR